MNNFNLTGIVEDVENINKTSNGLAHRKIKVMVERNYKDYPPECYVVSLFKENAETEIKVGEHVEINGKLLANNYEKNGIVYFNVNLVANSITVVNK